MSSSTITRVRSQIEKWTVNDEFCVETGVVTAKADDPLTDYDIQGCLLVGNVVAAAGDESSITGVVLVPGLKTLTLASEESTTEKFPILRRGPAILDRAGLPMKDPMGGTYNLTTVTTRLLTLGIKVVTNSALSQSAPA